MFQPNRSSMYQGYAQAPPMATSYSQPPPGYHHPSLTPSQSHSRPHRHHSHSLSQARPPRSGYPVSRDELWQIFNQVDADRSGAISVTELQRALRNEDWQPFDIDTVKMLMNYFDRDHNGTIGFDEFAGLFKYIYEWQQVFKHFDRDNSHTIDRNEMQAALGQFGYNLSPQLNALVQMKYGALPTSEYAPSPGITFDRFVRACVSVKWLSDTFQRHDSDRDGWITVNYEQFMKIFFEAP